VLVLTTFDLDEYVFDALRAGASGFPLKDALAEDLVAPCGLRPEGTPCSLWPRRVIEAFAVAPAPAQVEPRTRAFAYESGLVRPGEGAPDPS
jgi:hypothetical protein